MRKVILVVGCGVVFLFGSAGAVPHGLPTMGGALTLEATIPYNVFKRIAQSQSVDLQVGRDAVTLSYKNRAALRDLNSRVLPKP